MFCHLSLPLSSQTCKCFENRAENFDLMPRWAISTKYSSQISYPWNQTALPQPPSLFLIFLFQFLCLSLSLFGEANTQKLSTLSNKSLPMPLPLFFQRKVTGRRTEWDWLHKVKGALKFNSGLGDTHSFCFWQNVSSYRSTSLFIWADV